MLIENLVKDYHTFDMIFTRLSGMKIVTGAEGFIGSNLVAGLEAAGEDIAICESVHLGLQSQSYDQGPFMIDPDHSGISEIAVKHFHALIHKSLGKDDH